MAVIRGTLADDRLGGTTLDDLVDGLAGHDRLSGGAGHDHLRGGAGDDRLYGDDGDDRLEGGAGDDRLDGGRGSDTASWAGAAGPITADLGAGVARGEGTDRLVAVENLEGGAHDDVLTGDGLANRLSGGGGHDRLAGAGGNDRLFGRDGDDFLVGGAGDDWLDGGRGVDTASYADAGERVRVWAFADGALSVVGGASGRDVLVDVEVVEGSRRADVMSGHVSREGTGEGTTRVDQTFRGLGGNDQLSGGAGSDTLEGGTGDDVLRGDGEGDFGDDRLFGGAGDDRLVLDLGGDDLHAGGQGRDVFELRVESWQPATGTDVIADFTAGLDRLEILVGLDGGGTFDGLDLVALLDRDGDGDLGAGDAGAAGGWSLAVEDVMLDGRTEASLVIGAEAGGGYTLSLFGVTELAGADVG